MRETRVPPSTKLYNKYRGEYMKKTTLTVDDYNNFYKGILYGNITDSLETAIFAAYRDLCRTIHGFSKNNEHDKIIR